MKKLLFAAVALMVLAGSTFTVPAFSTPADVAVTPKKPAPKPSSIPPPGCDRDDPQGCGIFG